MIQLTIDGMKVQGKPGEPILTVAKRAGIDIPNLCAEPRLPAFDSCGICVVEVEGKGVVRSCSTPIAEGMVVHSRAPTAEQIRKAALELLLSTHWGDCIAPCQLHCPAHTDCQGYVGLAANGLYFEGLKLLYEHLPLPASLSRICPAPCEEACRRQLVEEPIQIRRIKRFLADLGLGYIPPVGKPSGYRVAVVGSGPAGLSAAYFLRRLGHAVVVFEAKAELGGMLRYGIPAFRLPHAVLDREIEVLRKMEIEFRTQVELGRDITLDELERDYHAVFLGLGAWKSRGLGVPGEDLPAVFHGIEFLAQVKTGRPPELPAQVAVIGGGNTAIDAARTARRLGADVVILYRRGREEMPAQPEEVEEAEQEGVQFEFLTQPLAFLGNGQWLLGVKCQRMQLSEPDASGRRKPVPIPGAEFVVPVQAAILAVGQEPDTSFLAKTGLVLNRDGTIQADPETGQTSRPKVFAGGDVVSGPALAVDAVAFGHRAALAIDRFLRGLPSQAQENYVHKKHEVERKDLGEVHEASRIPPRILSPLERLKNFRAYEARFTKVQAEQEASRCLECGCSAVYTCLLREYATQLQANQEHYQGEVCKALPDKRHPFIVRDQGKCILCGRCVRVCDEVCGIHAIDFAYRGFSTEILTPFNKAWQDSDCVSCGACVDTCPTGALASRPALDKFVPLKIARKETVCTLCGFGCPMVVETLDGHFFRVVAPEGQVLCAKGRYGWQVLVQQARITRAFLRKNGKFKAADWTEALRFVVKHLPEKNVVFLVDPGLSEEEAKRWIAIAAGLNAEIRVAGQIGLKLPSNRVAGAEALASADLFISVGPRSRLEGFVLGLRLRQAQARGVEVLNLLEDGGVGHKIPWPKNGHAKLAEFLKKATNPVLVFESRWVTPRIMAVITELLSTYPHLRVLSAQGTGGAPAVRGLLADPPPKISACFIIGANPFTSPKWAPILTKTDLIVVFSAWLNKLATKATALFPLALPIEAGGTFFLAQNFQVKLPAVLPPPFPYTSETLTEELAQFIGVPVSANPKPSQKALQDLENTALLIPSASVFAEECLRRKGLRL